MIHPFAGLEEAMGYFFVNTDARSLGGVSPHDLWFEHGYAFSGGPERYGKKFGAMAPGDICLIWANKIGIVGAGRVLESWDRQRYTASIVYKGLYSCDEYRIKVDWFLDLRSHPISSGEFVRLFGWNPRGSVQRARRDEKAIENLIERLTKGS